jgi:transcriptional regulator with XRE-family HTH domain/DNA-binding Xre family transcriptional regulator/DNA-binding XRE family transcriptional regulator
MVALGKEAKMRMALRGIKHSQIAETLSISDSTLFEMLAGLNKTITPTIKKICRHLEIKIDDYLGLKEGPNRIKHTSTAQKQRKLADPVEIGRTIKAKLIALGLTPLQLAERTSIPHGYISTITTGRFSRVNERVVTVCDFLQIPIIKPAQPKPAQPKRLNAAALAAEITKRLEAQNMTPKHLSRLLAFNSGSLSHILKARFTFVTDPVSKVCEYLKIHPHDYFCDPAAVEVQKPTPCVKTPAHALNSYALANEIRKRLRDRGITSHALARSVDVCQKSFYNILLGRFAYEGTVIKKICKALVINIEDYLAPKVDSVGIASEINKRLKERGLKPAQLAKQVSLGVPICYDIRAGRFHTINSTVRKIGDYLGIPLPEEAPKPVLLPLHIKGPKDNIPPLALAIRKKMAVKGITQTELAKALSIFQGSISGILGGRCKKHGSAVRKLCTFLGINFADYPPASKAA